jgi:hypothetical protein
MSRLKQNPLLEMKGPTKWSISQTVPTSIQARQPASRDLD